MMEINKKNLIVTLADANFINQAKQLFASVYFNAGWKGDYMLLTHNISLEDKNWFESKGIIVYDQPLLFDSHFGPKNYPPIILSKLYLFKEYFKQWNKVIFLDADIIVKASLDGLLKLKGFSAPNANALRLKDQFIVNKIEIINEFKKINLRGRALSTGVFVFDTNLIQANTFLELIGLYNKYEAVCQLGDESVLNIFFYKNWNMLPITYNFIPEHMAWFYGLKPNKMSAFLFHFVCTEKPWSPSSPYYEEWSNNLKRAAEIDLNNRPKSTKVFTRCNIIRYNIYLKFRRAFCYCGLFYLSIILKFKIINASLYIDKQIGKIGMLIKKNFPRLYKILKFTKHAK